MLNSLTLKNYRAFREQRFNFSKLNIFVGPNNSGKSSAISAINLLAQTVSNVSTDSPLILNGEFDDLGTFIDVIHGNRSNTPLGMEFSLDDYKYSIEFKYQKQRREINVSNFKLYRKNKNIYSYNLKKNGFEIRVNNRNIDSYFPDIPKSRRFFGFFPIDRRLSRLSFRNFEQENLQISKKKYSEFTSTYRAIHRARTRLLDEFTVFDSLGPFRAPPQRTYLYAGIIPETVGKTGDHSINLLVGDSVRRGAQRIGILHNVSEWFKSTGIAKEIRVKTLTTRHFEICLVGFDGREQNICDVGFGCSQVLPVLVGGLNVFFLGMLGNSRTEAIRHMSFKNPKFTCIQMHKRNSAHTSRD